MNIEKSDWILAGMLIERRRRRRSPSSEIAAYPKIDLNDPRQRRVALSLLGVPVIFVFMSAFGSYRAYEYTESVEFCGQACHTVMKRGLADRKCTTCHKGNEPFKLPVNLGDISLFQCVECHPKKN